MPVVMIAYMFYGIYVNFIVGIYIKKQSKYLPMITGISALINISLNYLLIPGSGIVNGMMGAAVATVTAYAAMALILLIVTRRFYHVEYEYRRLFHLVAVICLLFWISTIQPVDASTLMKAGLIIAYPFILLATGFYYKEEKQAFKKKILKLS